MVRFLDANILLRFLAQPVNADDQRKAELARDLLLRVERGEERITTSVLVIFETVFTLHRSYRAPRDEIRDRLTEIISMRGLALPGKRLLLQALQLFAQTNLSFGDAYNVVTMRAQGLTEIYTWDTDFDRIPGIARVEPEPAENETR
jgi:predicted nucleic acid-binding protein